MSAIKRRPIGLPDRQVVHSLALLIIHAVLAACGAAPGSSPEGSPIDSPAASPTVTAAPATNSGEPIVEAFIALTQSAQRSMHVDATATIAAAGFEGTMTSSYDIEGTAQSGTTNLSFPGAMTMEIGTIVIDGQTYQKLGDGDWQTGRTVSGQDPFAEMTEADIEYAGIEQMDGHQLHHLVIKDPLAAFLRANSGSGAPLPEFQTTSASYDVFVADDGTPVSASLSAEGTALGESGGPIQIGYDYVFSNWGGDFDIEAPALSTPATASPSPGSYVPPSGTIPPGVVDGRIAFEGCVRDECGIFVVNPDGTDLTRWAAEQFVWYNPTWSPDGRRLAVSRLICPPDIPCYSVIAVVDEDGSVIDLTQPEEATYDDFPAWSPDGTRILFSSNRETSGDTYESSLFTIAIDGSGLTHIDTGAPQSFRPDWSPDGAWIVFDGRDAAGNTGLFTLPADGSENPTLIYGTDYGEQPDWSPDGGRIGWTGQSEPVEQPDGSFLIEKILITINTDGTGLIKLQPGHSLSWSPTGEAIAYFDDAGVWIAAPDGGDARMLDVPASAISGLDWGPPPR